MKQLLLATATLVGMSAAALAAEPVALSDSQLDNVTAGQIVTTNALGPTLVSQAGIGPLPGPAVVAASAAGTNATFQNNSVPTAP